MFIAIGDEVINEGENEKSKVAMNPIKKVLKAIRAVMIMLHKHNIRRKIVNNNVSIISQNCVGGVIYNLIGQEFASPTINLFIKGENFVKLVENLEYYMSIPAKPLCDKYVSPSNPDFTYPKILVGDIEVCCQHYKDCNEAIAAWERRRKRIDFNKVLVIANSWDLNGDKELIQRVCSNPKYKTICFTYGQYDIDNCICLTEDFWKLTESNVLTPFITGYKPRSYKRYFEDYIDIPALINKI